LAYRAVPVGERAGDDEALASRFDKVMAAAVRMFSKAGVSANVVRLRGPGAGDAIAAYARKRRLDVLAMGSHGQGAFKSLVLGSVAMRVAARCDKPLLLIREAQRSRNN
ncbi:MAG: universal stress protein, partial [Rubrivivax sp.]|nr:universal stress protein [Rubrivivax sp.]